jgi:hypothetical protein
MNKSLVVFKFTLLPHSPHHDNQAVRALKGVRWLVIKTPPLSRNFILLKSILSSRFPHIKFEYQRFQKSLNSKISNMTGVDGVIAVLKNFEADQIALFDRLTKKFSRSEIIFVLSPKTYQILQRRRKKALDRSLFLLSEIKCLDYIAALPRLINEVSLRHRLRRENDELQKLFRQNWDGPLPEEFKEEGWSDPVITSERDHQIAIRFMNWSKISKDLGQVAELEFDQIIQRVLSSSIRGSDRVMRRKQNEYLLFFNDVDTRQLQKCKQRLSKSLKALQLSANNKRIPLRFQLLKEAFGAISAKN